MKYIIVALIMISFFACSDSDQTVSTLQKAGFTEIRTTGWNAFQCGEGDVYSTGFIAKNPKDVQVSGTRLLWLDEGLHHKILARQVGPERNRLHQEEQAVLYFADF